MLVNMSHREEVCWTNAMAPVIRLLLAPYAFKGTYLLSCGSSWAFPQSRGEHPEPFPMSRQVRVDVVE